jgi:hypothetical protein
VVVMLHKEVIAGDIHVIQQWEVADETERLALTVAATDIGKVVYQQDTEEFYILTVASPATWVQLGGGGGTAATTTYDNTTSGLTATNVQDAIDETYAVAQLANTSSNISKLLLMGL